MAGSIIIKPGASVAFSSRGFHLIVELIREKLQKNYPELIEHIYDPMDMGGMPFISIELAGKDDFKRFYAAARDAFSEWRAQHSERFPEWQELLDKLEADDRLEIKSD